MRSRELEAKLKKLEGDVNVKFQALESAVNKLEADAKAQANSHSDFKAQLADAKTTFSTSLASLQLLVQEELNAVSLRMSITLTADAQ